LTTNLTKGKKMDSPSNNQTWDQVLSLFPEAVRADIASIRDYGGCLKADRVEKLMSSYEDIGALMISLLPVAAQYAVVPVSNFHVGAVAAGMAPPGGSPSLYLGSNFEYTGISLPFTVHGEQSATNNAWLNGETGIQALAISAAPCGYCRQFLYELVTQPTLSILLPTGTGNQYTTNPLGYYLPDAFGPHDLGIDGGLMDPKYCTHNLTLNDGSQDPLVLQALAAAQSCYAPYTSAFAGCALLMTDNSVYTGRYAENAAYNPTLLPLESALTFMNMNQAQSATRQVARAVLVEVPTTIGQAQATLSVLSSYDAAVTLEYHGASVAS
jgi:cytidine deaminase